MHPPSPAEHLRLVRRAHRDLGSRTAVADLLGVPRAAVDAWLAGAEVPDHGQRRVLRDLALVHDRLRVLPAGRVPSGWFRLPCADLEGATPEDVLVVDGAARVVDAIERTLG